ncbi:MAG: hypothetical protein O7H39_18650 [Gammaproteobacteria bacterium]|nr:hypothetical protein [Gammaproteobacteria bacterium]
MTFFFLAFGCLSALGGMLMLIEPGLAVGLVRRYSDSLGLYLTAIVSRAIVGFVFFAYAEESTYPAIFEIIGVLAAAGVIVLAGIGRSRFARLMKWWLDNFPVVGRVGGLFGMALGGFIVYAVT